MKRLRHPWLAALAAWVLAVQPAWGLGPFERNDPHVSEGMAAYDKGEYDTALQNFEEAKKDHPRSAAVEFDRGNALFQLGRADEAKEAYHHVNELDQGSLGAKDFYNLGDTWAKLGNDKEAIAAFRKSLTLNPQDKDARHNLEVMLRKLPPPKQQGPDGGTDGGSPDGGADAGRQDAGQPKQDGGSDGGSDGGRDGGGGDGGTDGGSDGGQGDGGGGGGKPKPQDGGQSGGAQRGDGGSDGGEGEDGGMEEPERMFADGGAAELNKMSKEDAERLLDSMKRDERNLQLWRFQQRKPKKTHDKDW